MCGCDCNGGRGGAGWLTSSSSVEDSEEERDKSDGCCEW